MIQTDTGLRGQSAVLPVDVIICHHDGVGRLAACLASLYSGTRQPARVLVVDNASSDGSRAMLRARYPQVTVLRSETNLGFVNGNLLAYDYLKRIGSSHRYIWLLNNDTVVGQDALLHLCACLERDLTIAAVQPKMRSIPFDGCFDYAGGAGGYLDEYGFPFARGRLLTTLEHDNQQYDAVADIFWASGAAFFVRRSVTEEVDLFDPAYHAVSEEIDLSWRILLRGYRIVCEPRAVVAHHGGFRPDKMSAEGMYWRHRNSLMTVLKNYSAESLRRLLPGRLVLEGLAIGYALAKADLRYAWAVCRSLCWIIVHLRMILRQRCYIQQHIRRVSDDAIRPLQYRGSIALVYYLGGVRRFSELTMRDHTCDSPVSAAVPDHEHDVIAQADTFLTRP